MKKIIKSKLTSTIISSIGLVCLSSAAIATPIVLTNRITTRSL